MSTLWIKTKDQKYQLYQYKQFTYLNKVEKGLIPNFHFNLEKDMSKRQVNINRSKCRFLL